MLFHPLKEEILHESTSLFSFLSCFGIRSPIPCHMLIWTMVSERKKIKITLVKVCWLWTLRIPSRSTPFNWKMIVVKGHQDAAKHARKFPSNYITQWTHLIPSNVHHSEGKLIFCLPWTCKNIF